MKRILIHILFILSLFMIGCSSNRREEAINETESFKTEKEFTEEIIVDNSKTAKIQINEQLVEQKLKDLEDYINLLMDKEIPIEFTVNINEQIQSLIYVTDSSDTNYIVLNSWIEQRVASGQKIQFSNIKIIKESIQELSGGLLFNVQLKLKIKKAKNKKVSFSFILKGVEKKFGTETMTVNELKIVGVI